MDNELGIIGYKKIKKYEKIHDLDAIYRYRPYFTCTKEC